MTNRASAAAVAVLISVVFLGSACPGVDPDADRANYYTAISMPPGQAAHDACGTVRRGGLRSECQAYNAEAVAKTGDGPLAHSLCDGIEEPMWREECWFLTTDELGLTGDDAVRACVGAGRYRHNCVGHAIGREVRGIEKRYGLIGQEVLLHTEIMRTVKRYKPGAPKSAQVVTADSLVARILASRWGPDDFDASLCGKAPDAQCARAYRSTIDATPRQVDVEGLCEGPIQLDRVRAIGARGWTPESYDLAQVAWTQMCADIASGWVVRDGSRGMGPAPIAEPGILPGEMVKDPRPGAPK